MANMIDQVITLLHFDFSAYLSWGCLYSVYPPLYPNEAFRKGLLPSEVINTKV